jgi:16S rRNA (cytosine967-C5)-methyltransferase
MPPILPPRLAANSLAAALEGASQAVGAVRLGMSLPAALTRVKAAHLAPQTRGAIQDIAYGTVRALGLSEALLAMLAAKPPAPPIANLLICALALLIAAPVTTNPVSNASAKDAETDMLSVLADGIPIYAPFTIVDQAVQAVSTQHASRAAKGLVNAILRTFLRNRNTLLAQALTNPTACWNAPPWWLDKLRTAWPEQWQNILRIEQIPAPLTLRINQRRHSVQAYRSCLEQVGMPTVIAGPAALQLLQAVPVAQLPGFADGAVSVQDAGAQLAAPLLNSQNGMRVLDACAAPGGKSGHLLELADIDLVALDNDPLRVQQIHQNLARLGLHAQVCIGDATNPEAWWDGQPFERILADVPCSASGIVRRHPDIRWLRRASDLPALVKQQRNILRALWPLLARGGELLYATCSIFPEEGELQAQWFEHTQTDALRLDAVGQLLPSAGVPEGWGGAGSELSLRLDADYDGFFYARFQKQ